eukprot:TRINITY_DN11555_c0_g1_i1.p1 TRINITY_DN11555_c0_g1~~TRINITY_DN11555_c0_g1_i1.p1  ORF type:complete len:188 (+),score=72.03 TRINITY_DN11555_c0_g1_i1:68-631(+)
MCIRDRIKEEAVSIANELLNKDQKETVIVLKSKEDEKAKEGQVDLEKLFRQKPSEVIFLESARLEKPAQEGFKVLDIDKEAAEQVLAETKSEELWPRQIDIIAAIVFKKEICRFDITIIISALNLFVSCTLINSETFRLAQGYSRNNLTFASILMKGLTYEDSQSVREEFLNAASFLCYSRALDALG